MFDLRLSEFSSVRLVFKNHKPYIRRELERDYLIIKLYCSNKEFDDSIYSLFKEHNCKELKVIDTYKKIIIRPNNNSDIFELKDMYHSKFNKENG